MRGRRARRACLFAALAGCSGFGALASTLPARAAVPAATKAFPAHLLIYAQEWSLWPSRTRLPAGTIDVQLWNRGQDAHDAQVRRIDRAGAMVGAVLGKVSVTASGDIHTAVWHLRAGRYEIYCSMPGHLAMGMHARITVSG